jgi:hypothetical protein
MEKILGLAQGFTVERAGYYGLLGFLQETMKVLGSVNIWSDDFTTLLPLRQPPAVERWL